jgi:NAD(P)H dehydrogenase (quinone)
MHIVIVFDHPYGASAYANEVHRRSFSAALLHAAVDGLLDAGNTVDVIDLAADGFDPVMSADDLVAWRRDSVIDPLALDYQRRLRTADRLIFLFPVWWEAMPASTKGFLDKVITEGFAYAEPEKKFARFVKLLDRLGGVTVVTVTSIPTFLYRWRFRQPASSIILRGTFDKFGVKNLRHLNYAGVADLPSAKRRALLDRTRDRFAVLR